MHGYSLIAALNSPAACTRAARPLPMQHLIARCSASDSHVTHTPALSRRAGLAAAALLVCSRAASAAVLPPAPQIGDCPECIGEVNDTLNTCSLDSTSCISTLNDDEAHFAAPWMYDTTSAAAIERLVEVATGGRFEGGLIGSPYGISQGDAAAFIAGGVLAVVKGEAMPPQPKRRISTEFVPFDGVVVERHVTPQNCQYLRITLGAEGGEATEVDDPAEVVDAEFLFLPNDNIVVVRAASRVQPQNGGQLQLSFTNGVILDKNSARRKLETLRQALRWELAPVITEFDPRFNANAPLWFERLFNPFDERNQFVPSGQAYPVP